MPGYIDKRDGGGGGGADTAEFPPQFEAQVMALSIPDRLAPVLYDKLRSMTFDAGNALELEYTPREGFRVCATRDISAESDIFLIDHAITYIDRQELADALTNHPGLLERLARMMALLPPLQATGAAEDDGAGAGGDDPSEQAAPSPVRDVLTLLKRVEDPALCDMEGITALDLDDAGIADGQLQRWPISALFPKLERLSLEGNKLESSEAVVEICRSLVELKGIWLRRNPLCSSADYWTKLQAQLPPSVEILDSKFTPTYGAWAVAFASDRHAGVLDLSDRDIDSLRVDALAEVLQWPSLRKIDLRGNPRLTLDAHKVFARALVQRDVLVAALLVDDSAPLKAYAEIFPTTLTINGQPTLWLSGGDTEEQRHAALREKVMATAERFSRSYSVTRSDIDHLITVSFLMDELGSRLRESSSANCRLETLHFEGQAFSIIWPIRDVARDEELTYAPDSPDTAQAEEAP